MGLFDGLPDEQRGAEALRSEGTPSSSSWPPVSPPSSSLKRKKDTSSQAGEPDPDRPPAKVSFTEPRKSEVTLKDALGKIEKHIGKKSKCAKACGLLRKIVDEQLCKGVDSEPFFSALRASMRDRSLSADPELRRAFRRLFLAAEAKIGAFSPHERAYIKKVYSLLAIVRTELYTDDSFLFNKRVQFLKAEFEALGDPISDEALRHLHLEALCECLEAAESVYSSSWTRTATDLLASKAYERSGRFDEREDLKERLLRSYRSIERQRLERRKKSAAAAGGGGTSSSAGGASAFEDLEREYRGRDGISKRSGQGGGESWRGNANVLG